MKRPLIAITGALLLAGCDRNLSQCEDGIKAGLRSPSTYERVGTEGCQSGSCLIEYDAANAYGTPVRSKAYCAIKNGDASILELRQ